MIIAHSLTSNSHIHHLHWFHAAYFFLFLDCSYTAILKKSMGVLLCESFAGESYLVEDPNIVCYTPEHNVMRAVGVCMLIAVGIGYPLFTTLSLMRDMKALGMPSAKSFRRYSFLFDSFKGLRLTWWNSILLVTQRLVHIYIDTTPMFLDLIRIQSCPYATVRCSRHPTSPHATDPHHPTSPPVINLT